jgi:hypothetical protein
MKTSAQDSLILQRYKSKQILNTIEFCVGINSSTIRGIHSGSQYIGGGATYYVTKTMNKVSYSYGINITHNFNRRFRLLTRVLWETKGIKQKTDSVSFFSTSTGTFAGSAPISKSDTKNDYITISLIPQFVFGKKSNFMVGAGTYFGILEKSGTVDNYYYPTPHSTYSHGYVNNYDCGISVNAGYIYRFKEIGLSILLTDNYGLLQISNWRKMNSNFPSWYNTSYSITLGISFNRLNKIIPHTKILSI